MTLSNDNIMRLLKLTAFQYTDYVWWREDDGVLSFYAPCSDLFDWGCADCEEVTDENIDSLIDDVTLCEDLLGRYNGEDGFLLWCCRQRKMRPQGAYYNYLDEQLWPLFDACGPERAVGLENPKERNEQSSI